MWILISPKYESAPLTPTALSPVSQSPPAPQHQVFLRLSHFTTTPGGAEMHPWSQAEALAIPQNKAEEKVLAASLKSSCKQG